MYTQKHSHKSITPSARFPQNSTNQLPTPAPKQPCNSAVEQLFFFFFFSVTQPPTCSIHKLGIIQTQTTEQEKETFQMAAKTCTSFKQSGTLQM